MRIFNVYNLEILEYILISIDLEPKSPKSYNYFQSNLYEDFNTLNCVPSSETYADPKLPSDLIIKFLILLSHTK